MNQLTREERMSLVLTMAIAFILGAMFAAAMFGGLVGPLGLLVMLGLTVALIYGTVHTLGLIFRRARSS